MYDEPGKEVSKGVPNRNRNLQFACTLAIGVVLLLSPSRVGATNSENHIQEIMAGVNGNSKIQFIVIKQEGGGNLWGPQPGETQSRVMLLFFDATGRETGKFKFPTSVNADANPQLIATQDFANLSGAPKPDFIIPPLLNPISGKVCFTSNPLNSNASLRTDCVSYGSFTGETGTNSGGCNPNIPTGLPAPALPIVNTQSLKRTDPLNVCGSVPNSHFVINAAPTPTNDASEMFTIPSATQLTQGQNLFNNETFQGNGRTCASCHIASLNLALPPSNIQSRFATLASPTFSFDPLFVAETKPSSFDAGFDFNLNTLVLTAISQPGGTPDGTTIGVASAAPCIGELQGIITSGSGATAATAKVLTQVSPTTYLVSGGMNPKLSGIVSDSNSCSGTVSSITPTAAPLGANSIPGVLGLEDPLRMRKGGDAGSFPQGRGLILENIDGFPPTPPVFRKSPHLLNLDQRTGPFGLSGCCVDLQSFATGAVIQHFPRTLARNTGGSDPDFRLPTSDELNDMAAFLNAQEFPPGAGTAKFNLNNFVLTDPQKRGQAAFFGPAKCSECHGGTVFAIPTVDIVIDGIHKGTTTTARFNTGVVNQFINSVDHLPCEPSTVTVGPCGSREFSVRQLFNAANLAPFFHDGSAATLRDAVLFYDSSAFNSSPAGRAIGGIFQVGPTMFDDIQAFLEGLSFSPFTPTFGPVGTVVAITGTNFTGATAVTFNGTAATSFTVASDTSITATVPARGTTGPITVTTPSGTSSPTTTRFTVTPAITSFTPASGPLGTVVTITGTTFSGFFGVTAVKFNGVAASFSVASDTSIAATVPTEAITGAIAVSTLDGTATSATSFTVLASTTTAVTAAPNPATTGQAVTFTATVSKAGRTGTPTGMVTFGDGSTALGTGTLNAFGVATFATSSLAAGLHSITAAYGGDANFPASTSAALPETINAPSDFAIGVAVGGSTSATVKSGQTAMYALQLSLVGGTATNPLTVTVSCTGAPAKATCSGPASAVTVTQAGPTTVAVSVSTTANGLLIPTPRSSWPKMPWTHLPILWVLPMLLVLVWLRRCKQTAASGRIAWTARSAFAASILLFAMGATMSGCGGAVGGGGGGGGVSGTPPGTYALTVTATSASFSHFIPLSLTVN